MSASQTQDKHRLWRIGKKKKKQKQRKSLQNPCCEQFRGFPTSASGFQNRCEDFSSPNFQGTGDWGPSFLYQLNLELSLMQGLVKNHLLPLHLKLTFKYTFPHWPHTRFSKLPSTCSVIWREIGR